MMNPTVLTPFDCIPVFYSEQMVADISSYSPSAGKPREVMNSWRGLELPLRVRTPEAARIDQLCLAHDRSYVEDVLACRSVNGFGSTSRAVADTLPWTSGAMLSAAREAIENRCVAVAPCSGFHHAGYAAGGGFCTFNGLMMAAAVLIHEGNVGQVGILDCDEHYGDGTDAILHRIHLKSRVKHYSAGAKWDQASQAESFLRQLPAIVESFASCDVLLYQAGADPHVDDPLGGWLTTDELAERDRLVFGKVRRIGLPVAWNLAGGYQKPLRRVLDIHDNTLQACANVFLPLREASGNESGQREAKSMSSGLVIGLPS